MYETPNKILEAAREINIGSGLFSQVGPNQWEGVLKRVFERFANTHDFGVTWLWSNLKTQGVCLQTENGLNYIGRFFKPKTEVWILFEDWDRTKKVGNYWVFQGTYGAAVSVLLNMHGIEYYIVDKSFNWMILETHHDVLIGVGEPAESQINKLKCAQQMCVGDGEDHAAPNT